MVSYENYLFLFVSREIPTKGKQVVYTHVRVVRFPEVWMTLRQIFCYFKEWPKYPTKHRHYVINFKSVKHLNVRHLDVIWCHEKLISFERFVITTRVVFTRWFTHYFFFLRQYSPHHCDDVQSIILYRHIIILVCSKFNERNVLFLLYIIIHF